jgi:very-short-patch-repair endonuclease
MSGVDVSFHIITENGETTILLTAEIEVTVKGYECNLTYKDAFIVNSEDSDVIDKGVESLKLEHPFCMLKSCESHIEVAFFAFALLKIKNLRPQVWVDQYRVDFAVPEKKVAIELDGHEWHNTREQRTYDAKRDRYLLLHGWRIIRFTGSEIHKDVMECVREAKDLINKLPTI